MANSRILALAVLANCLALPGVANAGKVKVLSTFPNCDKNSPLSCVPVGALLYYGGSFYGTTIYGGILAEGSTAGWGTIYEFSPSTNTVATLYSFTGPDNGDGDHPTYGLTLVKHDFYGTTNTGGSAGLGVVFSYDIEKGTETVVHSFQGGSDGAGPAAPLLYLGGKLYGTTQAGGANNAGTIFEVDTKAGTETVLFSFGGQVGNGAPLTNPTGALLSLNGLIYGVETSGGPNQGGGVFTFDVKKGTESDLTYFGSPGGTSPAAGLTYSNGMLFTTTQSGGSAGDGTVTAIDPSTGNSTMIYSFKGQPDGENPASDLLLSGNFLYGTTCYGGGKLNAGVIYKVSTSTGKEEVLHAFDGTRGGACPNDLISANGGVYGTTQRGGGLKAPDGGGNVFQFAP